MDDKYILDNDEKRMEEHLEEYVSIRSNDFLRKQIIEASTNYLKQKKPVTIRISTHDIEAMKIKASKLGVAYQTYINILIHKDASSI